MNCSRGEVTKRTEQKIVFPGFPRFFQVFPGFPGPKATEDRFIAPNLPIRVDQAVLPTPRWHIAHWCTETVVNAKMTPIQAQLEDRFFLEFTKLWE